MNMIECSERCIYQQGGCCGLKGLGTLTNSAESPCRYFIPESDRKADCEAEDKNAEHYKNK